MHTSTGAPEVKMLNSLRLKLQVVVSCSRWVLGVQLRSSRRTTPFFTTKPSPQPLRLFLIEVSTCPASVSQVCSLIMAGWGRVFFRIPDSPLQVTPYCYTLIKPKGL